MSSIQSSTEPRWRGYALWSLKIVLALVYLAAGGAKLAGVPMMVATFDAVGIGQWFRYLTGTLEVIGAVALLIPAYAAFGALLLAPIMVGAAVAHATVVPGPALPALVLLMLVLVVAYTERRRLSRLTGSATPLQGMRT